jgi:iron-sulfur cluster assembly accessory protein
MVMVTQTKSSEPSELFPNNPDDHAEAPSPSTTSSTRKEQPSNTYETLSDVLTVTPSCLSRVEALIQQRAAAADTNGATTDYFLRVFVDAGGCSGFTYQFEVDSELDEDEDIVVIAAADTRPRIVVDETSLGFLQGSTLDYVQEMIKSSFVVAENPQSESACGCGSSFAVKNFSANPALD